MKYLAFDLGFSHTGVAISYEGQLVQGLTTIHTSNTDDLSQKIEKIITQHQPDEIILGIPPKGPVRDLTHTVHQKLITSNLPIHLVDEDLSSKFAQKAQLEANQKQKTRSQRQHQVAAAAILQSYLDNLLE